MSKRIEVSARKCSFEYQSTPTVNDINYYAQETFVYPIIWPAPASPHTARYLMMIYGIDRRAEPDPAGDSPFH